MLKHNNVFGSAEPDNAKMDDSTFEMLNEEEIAELLDDEDGKNTQKATKPHEGRNQCMFYTKLCHIFTELNNVYFAFFNSRNILTKKTKQNNY